MDIEKIPWKPRRALRLRLAPSILRALRDDYQDDDQSPFISVIKL